MSHRNFGNPTSGLILRGNEQSARSHRAYSTPRDLKSFPRLPAESILHDEYLSDSALEIGAGCFGLIFLSAVIVALVLGFSILRFVGL